MRLIRTSCGAAAAALLLATGAAAQTADPTTIQRGQQIYATTCAACHGANLQGQPDWKRRLDTGLMPAPPHDATGHTASHSDRELFAFTRLGVAAVTGDGYESAMPAFGDTLGDDDIAAVLDYIKSTWPADVQQKQAAITAAEQVAEP
jgi:mono/diheme cytochrome c family protein